jgi:hypothetical protein
MAVTSDDVGRLIEALAGHPSVTRSGVRFAPIVKARFHEISPGTLTWDWCDRHPAERGLRAGLAYYDLDGQIVDVNVVKSGNLVTEIELWRGDDKPIQSVPQQADLWEMVPGQVYSPRT